MNFKDRGNKKWNSLMLVEHQRRLKELKLKEDEVKKPELDEQELAEINLKVQEALRKKLSVEITFYVDRRIKKIKGKIVGVDKYRRKVKFEQPDKIIINIDFDKILEISF